MSYLNFFNHYLAISSKEKAWELQPSLSKKQHSSYDNKTPKFNEHLHATIYDL